jgi:hypothetical protein
MYPGETILPSSRGRFLISASSESRIQVHQIQGKSGWTAKKQQKQKIKRSFALPPLEFQAAASRKL